MLSKILEVQKVGRFERLDASRIAFTKAMLVFGENGWGKSTLADLLRSVATGSAAIVGGRETLASAGAQKVRLLFERSPAEFSAGAWTGHKPTIAVYDQCFINDNVHSGDAVSLDHLKRQYGIVIGAAGVKLVRSIDDLTSQIADFDKAFRDAETAMNTALRTHGLQQLQLKTFVALETDDAIERLIDEKTTEVGIVEKSGEIGRLSLPADFDLPTDAAVFRDALGRGIGDMASGAHKALHDHIARHRAAPAEAERQGLSHEAWLEAGMVYQDSDHCAFCGQFLADRELIHTYSVFFGEQYKALAAELRKRRATLQRYANGDFRQQLLGRLSENAERCVTWHTLTAVPPLQLDPVRIEATIGALENCAGTIDRFFEQKQGDLAEPVTHPELEEALTSWNRQRAVLLTLNEEIAAQRGQLTSVRETSVAGKLDALRTELALLKARRLRADASIDAAVASRQEADLGKVRYTNERTRQRAELTAHSNSVAVNLGQAINAYLYRLGAGFKIDYQAPNYRGKDPAAAYHILINDVPVPPRSGDDNVAQPSFRNTLSTGDKSVLALFLPRVPGIGHQSRTDDRRPG